MKAKLRRQERTALEEPFGESTPSSKRLVKGSSQEEKRSRKGGALPGHVGKGRAALDEVSADEITVLPAPERCPDCDCALEDWGMRERTVYDYVPARLVGRLIRTPECHCPRCNKTYRGKVPGVFPRSMISNRMLAHVAASHYIDGQTMGFISRGPGLSEGTLFGRMHALAELLKATDERIVEAYRAAAVKHADETPWRTDGANGYTWGFFTSTISLFRCRDTRSSAVPREVLGDFMPASQALVVDRYAGYNFLLMLQYCYVHLIRDARTIEKENPKSAECARFAGRLIPLLAAAIKLRREPIEDEEFYRRAAELKAAIAQCVESSARHPSVQHLQSVFRENPERMYRWAGNREIPADNNRAERELRPLVIARKLSFGSQSKKGLQTREILMSVLNTLAKRVGDVPSTLARALDAIVEDPSLDLSDLLLGKREVVFPKPIHSSA